MTRLIDVMHKFLRTDVELADLLAPVLKELEVNHVIDLCSGSGGPMPAVYERLQNDHKIEDLRFTLTDLYPNLTSAKQINAKGDHITYKTEPVDATGPNDTLTGLRTMVSSFHHMGPSIAKNILRSAFEKKR